jgi:hypothetical protein
MDRRLYAAAVVIGIAGISVIGALAWPQPADTGIRQAYQQLTTAAIPALVVGWISPDAGSVELRPDGYTLRVHDQQFGDLSVEGQRDSVSPAATSPQDAAASRRDVGESRQDATYRVDAAYDQFALRSRLIPLNEGMAQLSGHTLDTPLLYLVYLPLLIGVPLLAAASLLRDGRQSSKLG